MNTSETQDVHFKRWDILGVLLPTRLPKVLTGQTNGQNQDRKETDLLGLLPHSHRGRVLHVQLGVGVALSSGVVRVLQGATRHTVTTPGWGV